MPGNNAPYRKTKPWSARCCWNGKRVYLGNFATYDEALAVEVEFRKTHPSRQGRALT